MTAAASGSAAGGATASTVSASDAPVVRMSSTSTIRSSALTGQPRRRARCPSLHRLGEDAAHGAPKPLLELPRRLEGEQHAARGGADYQRRVVRRQ